MGWRSSKSVLSWARSKKLLQPENGNLTANPRVFTLWRLTLQKFIWMKIMTSRHNLTNLGRPQLHAHAWNTRHTSWDENPRSSEPQRPRTPRNPVRQKCAFCAPSFCCTGSDTKVPKANSERFRSWITYTISFKTFAERGPPRKPHEKQTCERLILIS